MAIVVLTSKGQMTIPKRVREALGLQPTDKMIISLEGWQIILKPLKGNILDVAGSVSIPKKEKPINFHKVRKKVKERVVLAVVGEEEK